MSLHYLVKLEILIVPLNSPHLNPDDYRTACEVYCKRRCTKHVSLIWTN